jgi:hypothetical protein
MPVRLSVQLLSVNFKENGLKLDLNHPEIGFRRFRENGLHDRINFE